MSLKDEIAIVEYPHKLASLIRHHGVNNHSVLHDVWVVLVNPHVAGHFDSGRQVFQCVRGRDADPCRSWFWVSDKADFGSGHAQSSDVRAARAIFQLAN